MISRSRLPMTMSSTPRGRICDCISFVLLLVLLLSIKPAEASDSHELYRIRVVNQEYGGVEVSVDTGRTYARVGKVIQPASASARGFAASAYAPQGTVAAIAVHGIRIKTAGMRDCHHEESRIISIVPREFAQDPQGYGGHIAGRSGIYTDIPTGEAIFRNLSPFVGNRVLLDKNGKLDPIPAGYTPSSGDVIVIVVDIPSVFPREIILENRVDGTVQAIYPDRTQTIARVLRPVRGVGRFDATNYTGVGGINTNHTGVLTVSTAPAVADGEKNTSLEYCGGFMIQPSRHARSAKETAQVMVVGPVSAGDPWLEGEFPLFSGYIGLAFDSSRPERSFIVDVETTTAGWTPLPALTGRRDQGLVNMPGGMGSVTRIRLRFPELTPDWARVELDRSSRAHRDATLADALKRGALVTDGTLTLRLDTTGIENVRFARLYINGDFRGMSNMPPYEFTLDSRRLSEGEHVAEMQAVDAHGQVVKEAREVFFVQKRVEPAGDG